MEEIRELQRRLYEAQQGKSVNRLTDDNVVELVAKLIDRNLVELHLSGQGYITPKQLRNEIKDELLVSGGRISLTALHATINTDASVIEAKVDEMCAEDPDGLTLEQGQLIADYYLEDLATELNTELQEAGQITLGSFATRYNFSTDSEFAVERKITVRKFRSIMRKSIKSYDVDEIVDHLEDEDHPGMIDLNSIPKYTKRMDTLDVTAVAQQEMLRQDLKAGK